MKKYYTKIKNEYEPIIGYGFIKSKKNKPEKNKSKPFIDDYLTVEFKKVLR